MFRFVVYREKNQNIKSAMIIVMYIVFSNKIMVGVIYFSCVSRQVTQQHFKFYVSPMD